MEWRGARGGHEALVDVLIGECTGVLANEALALGWGRMWIARDRNIYTEPGEPWGLDNGAFRDWKEGRPFDGDTWRAVLDKAMAQPTPPLLAVVPDAPGDRDETLRMADEWLPQLPDLPWHIAVQDGMVPSDIEGYPIAGVFLGGTNAYKATAAEWAAWARGCGLRFHYGRAGTLNKVAHAMDVGADSIDSAFPMWTRQRWRLFVEAVTNGPIQTDLWRCA